MNTKRFFQFSVISILILLAASPGSVDAQSPQVLYAKPGGLTNGSCDSWANACELQYALTSAVSGQEIWVEGGVYKPGTDRTATFQLKSGVGLYGGFAGAETARDERDWQANLTILSGDIDDNDINNDDNFIAETTADIQDANAYHVVIGSGTDNTAVLDGFIITAGQANIYPNAVGGGMYNEGSPTLMNVTFSANLAVNGGGGLYSYQGSPTLTNVAFLANLGVYGGGGMYNYLSNPTLTNVAFSTNLASSGGGMFNNYYSKPTLTNVTFSANSANDLGGGMYNDIYSSPTLTNVTFSANLASSGGGIYNYYFSKPTLVNSILWGDSTLSGSEIDDDLGSTSTVTYSDVQGGWPGTGNIDVDPLFVDPANGNLHLQAGSPAIDSGTNTGCPATDFDGVIRPQDENRDGTATCDMGAFEFVQTVVYIKIDIKPGSNTNPINLASIGVVPVAVLTTAEFDAINLDPATVLFAGASPVRWVQKDIDLDGDMDLLFHFKTRQLNLDKSSTEASLVGSTFDGMSVEGTDVVKIVPPR